MMVRRNTEAVFGADNTVLLLWLALLTGLACGAALAFAGFDGGLTDELEVSGLIVPATLEACLSAGVSSILRSGAWLAGVFLCGFSAVGTPVIWALPVLHGMGDGLLTGLLLRNGTNGLACGMRILLPGLLFSYLLLAACREALTQSGWLRLYLHGQASNGADKGYRGYLLRFAGYAALLVICAVGDTAAAAAAGLLIGCP